MCHIAVQEIEIATYRAYLSEPSGQNPTAAVLLIHDVFGWETKNLRIYADRFADAGWRPNAGIPMSPSIHLIYEVACAVHCRLRDHCARLFQVGALPCALLLRACTQDS
jgi:hypothetical protein